MFLGGAVSSLRLHLTTVPLHAHSLGQAMDGRQLFKLFSVGRKPKGLIVKQTTSRPILILRGRNLPGFLQLPGHDFEKKGRKTWKILLWFGSSAGHFHVIYSPRLPTQLLLTVLIGNASLCISRHKRAHHQLARKDWASR